MSDQRNMVMNKFRDSLQKALCFIFLWLVRPWFWIDRWIKDQVFLINLRSDSLPPSFLARYVWVISTLMKLIRRCWTSVYKEYGLKCYSKWIGIHYGLKGRGYFNYGVLTDKEKLALYGEPRGCLEYFLKKNLRILGYEDGQSFLDGGCGRGQNIKVLSEYYPNSPIRAFDVNEGAVDVVRLGVQDHKQILIEIGSITDANYLDQYPSNGFNHVLVSHVFSLIMHEGEAKTRKLRQSIIDSLIRIASKTVLIIDGPEILRLEEPAFKIEQIHRAHYDESIIPYFNEHLDHGEVTAIFSSVSLGVLFKHY